jgi:hypothetical protein
MLSPTQFQAAYGVGWVIADGSSCTGTKYASVTGNSSLPDCRGYFLRGYNNGSSNNPDGTGIGGFQGNQNQNHSHGVSDPGHSHACEIASSTVAGGTFPYRASGDVGQTWQTHASGTGISINNEGGDEARPSCVTVNIFIRIN